MYRGGSVIDYEFRLARTAIFEELCICVAAVVRDSQRPALPLYQARTVGMHGLLEDNVTDSFLFQN